MKYYTPELEEFHVGFEYEEYSQGYQYDVKLMAEHPEVQLQILSEPELVTDWVKRVYELDSFISLIDGEITTYIPEVRVKYLDEQDIKDLGFESVWSDIDTLTFAKDHIVITWWKDSTHIRINYTTGWQLFDGQLKNKNEFHKVLTQLGITI